MTRNDAKSCVKMLERQHSSSSTNYLVSDSSIYPSNVTSGVTVASKTSPSRYPRDEISSHYDQTSLNASQRRHAFGAYKNLQGLNGAISITGGSTSLESFNDSPEPYPRVDYSQSYQHDPNHLSVPLTSDFVPVGSRLHFRHHSYDVPPPPPAPDDDGVRRRTLTTLSRGHHSFDSAPHAHSSYGNHRDQQNDSRQRRTDFYDDFQRRIDVYGDFQRRNADTIGYFGDVECSESRYRSSYHSVDARNQFSQPHQSHQQQQQQHHHQQQQQQQQQFRHSNSLETERPLLHFHRRHTEGGYEAYQPQQPQQQQQQEQLYNASASNYDHYHYNNSSSTSRLLTNCDDFADYQAREVYYNGKAADMTDAGTTMKPNDNHLDSNPGFYDDRFNNHASYNNHVENLSSVAQVASQPLMTSVTTTASASQIYPNEPINITSNKSYWEWNNNNSYNGGVQTYDYSVGMKPFLPGYPDVLQKNTMMAYNVSFMKIFYYATRILPNGPDCLRKLKQNAT